MVNIGQIFKIFCFEFSTPRTATVYRIMNIHRLFIVILNTIIFLRTNAINSQQGIDEILS